MEIFPEIYSFRLNVVKVTNVVQYTNVIQDNLSANFFGNRLSS